MRLNFFTVFFIFLLSFQANAQFPVDTKSGLVTFTDVIQLDGMSKDDIYKKAKFWIVSSLKSGDNMVELNGSNSDQIVGTGNISLNVSEQGMKDFAIKESVLNFKFIVFCKEGKLKYKITNFDLAFVLKNNDIVRTDLETIDLFPNANDKWQKNYEELVTETVTKDIQQLIKSFITEMNASNEDDW